MDGREIRLKRLMGDGKTVIIAFDHGLFDSPIPDGDNHATEKTIDGPLPNRKICIQ